MIVCVRLTFSLFDVEISWQFGHVSDYSCTHRLFFTYFLVFLCRPMLAWLAQPSWYVSHVSPHIWFLCAFFSVCRVLLRKLYVGFTHAPIPSAVWISRMAPMRVCISFNVLLYYVLFPVCAMMYACIAFWRFLFFIFGACRYFPEFSCFFPILRPFSLLILYVSLCRCVYFPVIFCSHGVCFCRHGCDPGGCDG